MKLELSFLVENWEVISLLVSNIIALYLPSPKQKKRSIQNG